MNTEAESVDRERDSEGEGEGEGRGERFTSAMVVGLNWRRPKKGGEDAGINQGREGEGKTG